MRYGEAGRCRLLQRKALFSLALLSACMGQPNGQEKPTPQPAMFSESEAYERFMGRWSRRLAVPFLEFAGLEKGDMVLDIGSGTGALAAAVLSQAGSARVVGIDPSSTYVHYARQRTGNGRATFEEGDAQKLRFADGSFDKTLSLLVINFIPDPAKALGEMVRVTRTGGVVAAAVWDYGRDMEMLRIFWDEAVKLDPSMESRDERHMPLCKQGELTALWREHGLLEVREEPIFTPLDFASFEDFWNPFLEGQGPAGAYVASLPEKTRSDLRERLRRRLQSKGASGPIRLSGRAWAVRGEVPEP